MNRKQLCALMLVLSLIVTLFSGNVLSVSAASESEISAQATGYVANWGTRGDECTELSDYAEAFYTGDYVYEIMSQLEGGTGTSDAYKSELYIQLHELMKSNHSTQTSYDGTRDLFRYTDCQGGDTSSISSFYSGTAIGPEWDSGSTWNREHTWPNSKGLNGSDENDIMMLRPTAVSENSSRGNTAYGESSGYYDPGKDVRGDCARIVLYVYTRWGNTAKMWGPNTNDSGVIESLEVLLAWMEEDPVDTWEMGRNDSVQSITGTRNVFVDYPEYAWLLFGEEVPADYETPSNNDGSSSGGSDAETDAPVVDVPVDAPEVGVAYKGKITTPSNGTYYMMGETTSSTWYINVSKNRADAVDVYLEAAEAEGGYRLYFMNGEDKTYIRAYERTDKAGSGTLELTTTEPAEYYTYDASIGTLVTSNGTNSFYLGTRLNGTTLYENISCSHTQYVTGTNATNVGVTQFVLELVLSNSGVGDGENEATTEEATAAPEETTAPSTDETDAPATGETTVEIDLSARGYTNAQEITNVVIDTNVTAEFDKGTNSNAPKYYDSGTAVRVYGGGTFTISASSGMTIKKIVLTFGSGDGSNEITADVGDYADGTWTGDATEVVFTVGGASGNRRIRTIEVTYAPTSGESETEPDPTETNPTETDPAETDPTETEVDTTPVEMSIPEALEAADGTNVIVTGVVVEIKEAWSSYNNMSYYIEDAAGNRLYIFRSTTQIGAGDTVTVTGAMTTYAVTGERQIAKGATAVIDVDHSESNACVDEDNNCKCDICSEAIACQYPETGTTAKCTVCGKIAEHTCENNDTDNICDLCGEEMPAEGSVTYSYTFEAKTFEANGEKDLDGVNWILAGDGGYWGYDTQNGKGQQFGSSGLPYTSLTLTSAEFTNVSSIKINMSGASSIAATVVVTVGGQQVGDTITLTKTATEYEITGIDDLDGAIVITVTQSSSKAIYVKSIEVTYAPTSDEEDTTEEDTTAPEEDTTAPEEDTTAPEEDTTAPEEDTTEEATEPQPIEVSILEAKELEDGTPVIVKGTVKLIDTPWNTKYNNISVIIVDGEGNEILVYQLATQVVVGDVITVTGTVGSYDGEKQIAKGATAKITDHDDSYVETYDQVTIPEALASDDNRLVIFSGTVTQINGAWSDQYGNMNVTVSDDEGNSIYIYRLFTKVSVGDIITVKGKVSSYNGDKQIDQGATAEVTGHATYDEVSIADALASNDGRFVTFTGTVSEVTYAWSDTYGNMSVIVTDESGNTILIHKLASQVSLGDVITVKGVVGSYNETKQISAGATAEFIDHDDSYDTEEDTTAEETDPEETDPEEDTTAPAETDPEEDTTAPAETDEETPDPTVDGVTYIFADYGKGEQYAKNEKHTLDGTLSVVVNDGHFTTQLRLYDSTSNDAVAVFQSNKAIKSLYIKAGYKDASLSIYGSNDGIKWESVGSITVSTSYADYEVDLGGSTYMYLKLDAVGAQVRVESVTIEYTGDVVEGLPDFEFPDSSEDESEETTKPEETTPEDTTYTECSIPEALAKDDGAGVIVTGTVKLINTPWNSGFGNITVTIVDEDGNELYVYRLATDVSVGDIIKITGKMGSYKGSKQIAQGATAEIIGKEEIEIAYDEVSISEALTSSDGRLVTFTGKVVEIAGEWNDSYGNMNVYVADDEGNQIYLYRLYTNVSVGDIITVKGMVGSYNGEKQIGEGSTAEIIGHEDDSEESEEETTTPEEETTTPEEETTAPEGETTAPEQTDPEETTPEETTPAETTPEETDPQETTPVETTPAETTPAETTPAETTPAETTPAETTPAETTPAETTPDETTPAETAPQETKPQETKPQETEPQETKPQETKPQETEPPVETKAPDTSSSKGGCFSSIGGFAVIISVSIAGIMMLKKKKED